MAMPSTAEQKAFWDSWNGHYRSGGVDPFMQRQLEAAVDVASRRGLRGARIIDVGCGSGWLGDGLRSFGSVVGIDLSEAAIGHGRSAHPDLRLIVGDFATTDVGGGYDYAVSADAIAHVPEQQLFVERVATILKPGGVFLLMTQNPAVWTRNSKLSPQGTGQIREWPSLARLRELLAPSFVVEHVSSLVLGGDRGFFRALRYVNAVMRRTIGRARWDRVLEQRLLLGREYVIEARRA
jgi:2-polyprenyl-3-methyl-5-hydroxy-6-metoxy-1,4-benzoquinol methylase